MRLDFLPNAICILRMLLVVPIVWLLLADEYPATLLLLVAAGLSDGLDGFLARRFSWRTRLGAVLDPLADKLLLVAVYVSLAAKGLIPVWLTATVVLRDVIIVAGAFVYHFRFAPLAAQPTFASKLNTTVQLAYGFCVVAAAATGLPGPRWLLVLGAAVFITTCISGLDYVLTYSRMAWRVRHPAGG